MTHKKYGLIESNLNYSGFSIKLVSTYRVLEVFIAGIHLIRAVSFFIVAGEGNGLAKKCPHQVNLVNFE